MENRKAPVAVLPCAECGAKGFHYFSCSTPDARRISGREAPAGELPTLQQVLDCPSTSYWLKDALRTGLQRDCVDAANDAEVLAALLRRHANFALYGLAGKTA